MIGNIDIQAIASVSPSDLATAIAALEGSKINDIFMQVADQLSGPEDIHKLAENLLKNSRRRFGK